MKHSSEQAPQMPTPEHVFTIDDTNTIQRILMEAFGDPILWSEAYGQEFRTLVTSEPDLADMYYEDPERCINLIATKLYSHTIH